MFMGAEVKGDVCTAQAALGHRGPAPERVVTGQVPAQFAGRVRRGQRPDTSGPVGHAVVQRGSVGAFHAQVVIHCLQNKRSIQLNSSLMF